VWSISQDNKYSKQFSGYALNNIINQGDGCPL
jgi:hypothetical protein